MAEKSNKRTIVATWTWNKGDKIPIVSLNGYEAWHTPEGDCLLCSDIRKEGDWEALFQEIISPYAQQGETLLFLHKNGPHYYTDGDRLKILECLKAHKGVRARVFGGGKEPLYYGWDTEYGIIGTDGGFPVSADRVTTRYEEKFSDLVISETDKQIRQKHFDHIWNAYWFTPKKLLLHLSERFKLWSSGYGLVPAHENLSLGEYLRQDPTLWNRLVCFAGLSAEMQVPLEERAEEYNFDAYEAHLKHSEDPLLPKIHGARQLVRKLLEAPPGKTGNELNTIETVFNTLLDLFKAIPPNA